MNFKEKIELLKQVKNEFGRGVDLDFRRISEKIMIEDVISTDFEELFLPLFSSKDPDQTFKAFFNTKLEKESYYEAIGSSLSSAFLSREDRNKIIDKYFKYAEEIGSFNLANFSFMNREGDENYINSKILTNKKLSEIMITMNSREVISKLWDKVLMTADEETINSLVKFLEDNKSEYTNLPLVILNKNISDENKISIIVKTYKQKDLNKYTTFMRENIVDLNDLDSFIEATVIQNNRVKEKERAVQDIMKRIFVGIRGNSSSINYDKFNHKNEFFGKYRKYMTSNFCYTILNENNYYTKRNSQNLISHAFENAGFEEKVKLAYDVKGIGNYLFENISSMMEMYKDDPDREKLVLNYMIKEYTVGEILRKISKDKFIELVNKYPDIFAPNMGYIIDIGNKSSWRRLVEMDEVINMLKSIDESVIARDDFSFIAKNEDIEAEKVRSFGFSASSNSSGRYYSASSDFVDFNNNFLKNIFEILSSIKSDVIKKKFYDSFFFAYADEDYVSSELLSTLTTVLDKETITKLIDTANKSSNRHVGEYNVFSQVMFKPILALFEKVYPEKYEDVKRNLESLETNLKIIINI